MRDILPPESALWNRVEQAAREVFGTFGFAEIRLPIFEQTDLFARSVGQETDIVSKEMYTFVDRPAELSERTVGEFPAYLEDIRRLMESGVIPRTESNINALGLANDLAAELFPIEEQSLPERASEKWIKFFFYLDRIQLGDKISLRPEATASVVRAYIEHGMQVLPGNVKLYYMGPMFRRERPQKGRYRQFYQIGAEVLGASDAPGIDAEVIEMLMRLFERLNLMGTVLSVNSIGCKNCRPAYLERLRDALREIRDAWPPRLEHDTLRRIES